ncbi:MAG: hypothetical protein GXO48_01050 [Chlorobi bacterium]|nr:hypothetical protein [Chlorobiota bacterium]
MTRKPLYLSFTLGLTAFLLTNFLWAQNVGIGTVSPQARLHITVPQGFANALLRIDMGTGTPVLIVQPNGSIGVNAIPPQSAIMSIQDTTRGIIIPRLTKNQRNNIASPDTGLTVYQTTKPKDGFWFYDGTRWRYMLTDRDMLWELSGDSLFSLPDTAIIVRGVATPIPGSPADSRVVIVRSRTEENRILIQPRTMYNSFPVQGVEFWSAQDTVVQIIDFHINAPAPLGFDGRLTFNQHYGGVWAMKRGFVLYTMREPRVAVDSLGRMGVRGAPMPTAWQHMNDQPSLYVKDRIVARGVPGYPTDGSEVPYLPFHNPCIIDLHDTTVDIGDTLRFWLRRCKSVRLNLDSGKVYKWKTYVNVKDFQSLFISVFTQSALANTYTGLRDTAAATVLALRNDTVVVLGNNYYTPTLLSLGSYARFRSDRVFYKFIKTTSLSLSPHCSHQGLIRTGYLTMFNGVQIHQGKYEGEEVSFIKVNADAWSRIVLAHVVVRNRGSSIIYPVRVSSPMCHQSINGAIVGRGGVILGSNVQWETNPRIIYNQ